MTSEDVKKSDPLCTIGGEVKWCSHYGKEDGGSYKDDKQFRDSAIPVLGYMQRIESRISKRCSLRAPFPAAKRQKQPRGPPRVEWINNMGSI